METEKELVNQGVGLEGEFKNTRMQELQAGGYLFPMGFTDRYHGKEHGRPGEVVVRYKREIRDIGAAFGEAHVFAVVSKRMLHDLLISQNAFHEAD